MTTPKAFQLFKLETIESKKKSIIHKARNWMSRWTAKPLVDNEFVVGGEVVYKYISRELDDTIFLQATVVRIDESEDSLDIAFYDDDLYHYDIYVPGLAETVPRGAVATFVPPKAGSHVLVNYEEHGKWFPGKITGIGPNGWADIVYPDNDFDDGVSRRRYRHLYE